MLIISNLAIAFYIGYILIVDIILGKEFKYYNFVKIFVPLGISSAYFIGSFIENKPLALVFGLIPASMWLFIAFMNFRFMKFRERNKKTWKHIEEMKEDIKIMEKGGYVLRVRVEEFLKKSKND